VNGEKRGRKISMKSGRMEAGDAANGELRVKDQGVSTGS